MGRRVVELLHQSLDPDRVVQVARNGPVPGDINQPESVELWAGDVVVDAVGPYLHDPTAIVNHCLRSGAHYIDLSELTSFHRPAAVALADFDQNHTVSSAIVQGCSTVPAMVDVLMPEQPGSTRTVLLSVGTQNEASAPLLFGLIRPLGRPAEGQGLWWSDTITRTLLSGHKRRYGSYPAPWGDDTSFYCGLDYRISYWALLGLSKVTNRMGDAALYAMCERVASLTRPFRRLGTPHGSLRLERRMNGGLLELTEVRATGNGLVIPALPAAWAAVALLGRTDLDGLTGLPALIDRTMVVAELRSHGYTVDDQPIT